MQRFLRICFAIVMLFFLFTAYAGSAETQEGSGNSDSHIYLLYGIDVSGGLNKNGRSDTMLLFQVDHTNKKITVVSIARDCLVNNGKGAYVKINTLSRRYSDPAKGTKLLCDAINRNFGVMPEGWFRINYDSFVSIVNVLDGITIDISAKEADYINKNDGNSKSNRLKVQDGPALLNASQALTFVRCRHLDNDLGRGKRQTRFVSALLDEIKTISPIQLLSIFNSLNGAWVSSYGTLEQLSLIRDLFPARYYEFESLSIPFSGTWRNGQEGDAKGIVLDLKANRKMLLKALGRE